MSGMNPEDAVKYKNWVDLKQRGFNAEQLYNLEQFGSIKTQLDYTTSTGLKLQAIQGKTTTIIGSYNNDMQYIVDELGNIKTLDFGARNGGFNVLNAPDELYDPKTFWESYNKPWLDEAIGRGDSIKVTTKPEYTNQYRFDKELGKDVLTGYGNEIKYLESKGYVYDEVSQSMIIK